LPELAVQCHIRARQGREGHPVRRERSPDEADPAANPHDPIEHVGVRRAAQSALIETVDLDLDRFDELEVVVEDLVGDRGDEAGGIEGTKAGLALGRGIEPLDRPQRSLVDRDDPIAPGDDVDRMPAERCIGLCGGGRGLVAFDVDRLQSQVDVVRRLGQVRPVARLAQSREGPIGQADSPGDLLQVLGIAPVEVDPEQLINFELPCELRLEVDLAIAPVRVVEPGPQATALGRSGRQRIEARSTATMIARNAIPYWSASIERSIRPGSSLLGTTSGRVEIGCSSIDLWTPVVGPPAERSIDPAPSRAHASTPTTPSQPHRSAW
jgi:hypothetical protein